jgi:predicted nucleic acid-binding protein
VLPIAVDPETNTFVWSVTLALADRFNLTVYDATYLELAHRRNLPLATLDKRINRGRPSTRSVHDWTQTRNRPIAIEE